MRYEDASGIGSPESNHEPIARADVDILSPGTYGPATGNAISGAGTNSGASGADNPGSAPAMIVAVHGAGGETTGGAGGFQAIGQYGALSIDAQGNFNYVRNAGTPDGVKDVFQYTLADSAGATSSTTLTIDIAQVAAAAAGQAVVALPAGVEMSDIHVNGRDLVIDMPDGTQMVIPNGAVFVPQLAIGDVEVPSANLAALLIDLEPQPAAGPPQSSGGNFADVVPLLDPGAPLGDLIPPTELSYSPPDFHEVNQFENTKPTVIIETPDNPAGAIDATDFVSEKGLPTRNGGEPAGTGEIADGNGSNNSDGSETNTGTIVFSAQDGLDNVAINNVVVTGVGQEIAGLYGTLTITGIDLATGQITYSYTLTDNNLLGDNSHDVFSVVVTDRDGDQATGSLSVHIIDDAPIARNDTDSTDLVTHVATGNVMTGEGTTSGASGADTVGADDATLTAVSSNNTGAADSSFDGSGNLVVEGEFGTLTIKADGSYTYTAHQDAPGGSSEAFTYTLTDGDGDPAQATLTLTNPDHLPTAGANPVVQLDDDALAGGNPGGVGDDADSANTTGTLSGSGGDGALSFVLTADGAPDGFTYSLQANGNLWVMQGSTHVLTITVNSATGAYAVTQVAAIDHPAGGNENNVEFNLSYTVTDSDGDHATGHLTVNVDDDTPVARNDADVLDSNGHAAGNVVTGVGTNAGSGGADSYGADGPGQLIGVSSNGTGQADSSFDASGNLIVHGSFGTLTIDAQGEYTYVRDANATAAGSEVFTYTIVDGDGDTTTATLTIAVPNIDSTPQIGEAGNLTVDEDGLPLGNSDNGGTSPSTEQDHGGSVTDSNTVNVDFGNDVPANLAGAIALIDSAGLDTQLTQGGQPITFSLDGSGNLIGQVNGTGPAVVTISLTTAVAGSGGNVTYGYEVTLAGPVDQTLGDNNESGITLSGVQFQVTDSDGDHAAAPGSFNVTIYDDVPSAEAITVNQDPEDSTVVVGLAGHYTPGADGVDLHDVTYNVTSGNAAELSYDGDTGQFTYNPTAGETGDVVFTYTIVDGDGDQATQTVTIHLADDLVPQIGEAGNLTVDEDGLPLGNSDNGGTSPSTEQDHGGSVTDSNTVNVDFGNDVPANLAGAIALIDSAGLDTQLTQGGQPITFSLDGSGNLIGQVNGTGPAVVTISLTTAVAGSGGNVTYGYEVTLAGPVDQTLGDNNESGITLSGVQFQVTDSDGDHAAAPGSFNVTIYDDVPSAEAITVNQDPEDSTVVVGLAGHYTPGADGVDLHDVTYNVTSGNAAELSYDGDTGQFTYNPTAGETGDVVFTYTIVDGDGDQATQTVTIHLADDSVPQIGEAGNLTVDEDGLPLGNSDNGGTSPSTEQDHGGSATDSNTVNVDFGNDVPANLAGAIALIDSAGLDTQLTQGGQPITFSLDGSGNLIGQVNGTGPAVVTISLTTAVAGSGGNVTYGYEVTLAGPVDQTLGDNNESGITLSGVQFQVTDSDGDHAAAPGSFNVTIYDDVPSAEAITVNQDPEDSTVVVGLAGHYTPGADGVDLHDVTYNVTSGNAAELSYDGDTGQFTYNPTAGETGDVVFTYTIVDGDGDQATQTVTIHLADDSVPQIGEAGNLTVDEDGLPLGNSDNGGTSPSTEQDHGGSATDSNTVNVDFGNDVPANLAGAIALIDSAGLDTQLTQGGQPITFSLDGSGNLIGQVNGTGPAVVTISLTTAVAGSGGNVTYGYEVTLAGPVDQTLGDNNESGITLSGVQFQVTDSDGDHAAAPGSFNVTIYDDVPSAADDGSNATEGTTLNVTTSLLANDNFGADGPNGGTESVTSVTHGVTTVSTPNGSGDLVIAGDNGTLTVHADGTYSYLASQGSVPPAGATETFTYTITDGDGDIASATLTINVADNNLTPTGGTVNAFVDDEGLSGGILGGTGDINANSGEVGAGTSSEAVWTGTLAGSGGDAPISFLFDQSLNGTAVTGGVGTEAATYSVSLDGLTLTASGPRGLIFTVHIDNAATGAYTLTLNDNVLNTYGDNTEASATVDIPYTVKDADTSTAPGTIHATFNDDMPTVTSPALGAGTVTVDESGPLSGSAPAAIALTDGVHSYTAGDDEDVTGAGRLSSAVSTGGLMASATINFGADGPLGGTAVAGTSYALNIAAGGASGVTTTEGEAINLIQLDNGNVLGVVQGSGEHAGLVAFAFSINASTGAVQLDQYLSLAHPINPNPNEAIHLGTGDLSVVLTGTDADGDHASAAVDISSHVTFLDDGPTLGAFSEETIPNDVGSVNGTYAFNWGADGLGGLTVTGPAIAGVTYTTTQDGNGGVTLHAMSGTTELFNLDVHPDGTYDFNLVTPDAASTVSHTLIGIASGQNEFIQTADGTVEFTPLDHSGNDTGTVNSSGAGFGNGNQFTGNGEAITFEFHNANDAGDTDPNTHPNFVSQVTLDVPSNGFNGTTELITWYATNTVTHETATGTILVSSSTSQLVFDPGFDFNLLTVEGSAADGQGIRMTQITTTTTTLPQSADYTFHVSATDGDGDPTGTSNVLIHVDASSSSSMMMSSPLHTLSVESPSTFSLLSSNDNEAQQKQAGTNTMVLSAALAADGMSTAHSAAAHGSDGPLNNHDNHMLEKAGGASLAPLTAERHEGHDRVDHALDAAQGGQHEAIVSRTPVHADQAQLQSHAGSEHHQPAQTELLQASAGPAHGGGAHGAHFAAQGISMPSAEQMAGLAATAGGPKAPEAAPQGQHNQIVGKVLADALHGGGHGHNIDHLLDAASGSHGGHGHANAALEALASQSGGAVPFGHMSFAASFHGGPMLPMMDALAVHQDAAPTHG